MPERKMLTPADMQTSPSPALDDTGTPYVSRVARPWPALSRNEAVVNTFLVSEHCDNAGKAL